MLEYSCGSDGRTACGSNGGFEPQGLINLFIPQHPREKISKVARIKTNSEGGRNPFPQTPRLPSALSWRRAERDAINNPDFRQKKFELQSKSGA
jgi:hypothetical protein